MVDDSLSTHENESAFINSEIMKIVFEYESQEEERVTLEAITINVNLNFLLKSQNKTIMNAWKNMMYRRIFPCLSLNLTKEYVATNTKNYLDMIKKLHFIFLTILSQYNSIVEDS